MPISRPQKFGKSLNISMAKKFLDIRESNSNDLFSGTDIMDDSLFVQANMQKHPVISIKLPRSLQRVKSFEKWRDNIKEYFGELSDTFFDCLKDVDKMEPVEVLNCIVDFLFKDNGEREVIILIDNFEYPLVAALKGGIINEAYEFYGKSVFPASLVSNKKILKIVSIGMLQIEIPGSIYSLDCLK